MTFKKDLGEVGIVFVVYVMTAMGGFLGRVMASIVRLMVPPMDAPPMAMAHGNKTKPYTVDISRLRPITNRPETAKACKAGINLAWMDAENEKCNIFRAHSLDLKTGFVGDMRGLEVLRFANACNVNGSTLSGSKSVLAHDSDLRNRYSTGWLGGSEPGMNPDLIVRVANQVGVVPWINLTHNTVLFNHREFIKRWALTLKRATARRVIVEISHTPWRDGDVSRLQSEAFARWAAKHLRISGVPVSASIHSVAAVLHFLGEVDRIMRPVLGDKLITVLSTHGGTPIARQWPVLIEAAEYQPDMVAISTHYVGDNLSAQTAHAQMARLFTVWDETQAAADEAGVMLACYDGGAMPLRNTRATRHWVRSAENGLALERLYRHITGVCDYACGGVYAYGNRPVMLQEPGVSTPAWDGFMRGCGRRVE